MFQTYEILISYLKKQNNIVLKMFGDSVREGIIFKSKLTVFMHVYS